MTAVQFNLLKPTARITHRGMPYDIAVLDFDHDQIGFYNENGNVVYKHYKDIDLIPNEDD